VAAIIIITIIIKEIMEVEEGARPVGLFKVIAARVMEEQLVGLIWIRYSCASFATRKFKMLLCVLIAQNSAAASALK
jgi:hypothetical protein